MYVIIYNNKATPPDKRCLDLISDQWDLLSQSLVVLEALQLATEALSLEQNVIIVDLMG